MNGAHDLGGAHGFGRVLPEAEAAAKFHAPWERDAFALTLAAGLHGRWNLDMSRFVREGRPAADYLARGYYDLWLTGLEVLAGRAGMLDGAVRFGPAPGPEATRARFAAGFPVTREAGPAPRFAVGDRVRVRADAPAGHTRSPRYCRNAEGIVIALRGNHVFPDSHAHGLGEDPQPLFTVRFEGTGLWGSAAEPNTAVLVDLWQPYLDPAGPAAA